MEKKQLIVRILIGIPASGKSTYTKNFLLRNEGWAAVSRDDFRYGFMNRRRVEPKIESVINDMMEHAIIKLLNAKMSIIIDATNLKRSYIEEFCSLVKYKARVEFQVFDTPLLTCIERDKARERSVGEDVIRKMYKDYLNIIDSDVFTARPQRPGHEEKFVPLVQDTTLPEAVIFDIDGTLAQMGKRSPYDWNLVDRDDPINIVIEALNFHKSLGRKILLVTGRDKESKALTEYWLNFYGIHFDELHTRPNDDKGIPMPGRDVKIKKYIFTTEIQPRFHVICCYDDRLSVVKECWYKLGIFCFNVNQGLKYF